MRPAVFVDEGLPKLLVVLPVDTSDVRRRNMEGTLIVQHDIGEIVCVIDFVVMLWKKSNVVIPEKRIATRVAVADVSRTQI